MAREIAVNAKMRRVSVCGATETLLIDRAAAPACCRRSRRRCARRAANCAAMPRAARSCPAWPPPREADWTAEYLAPILSVRVVDGLDAAIAHIARYGSGHTDAIVTAGRGGRGALPRRGRQRDPALERLDPVRRRRRVRLRRRDRHRHRPAARARPGRAGAAHDVQICGAGGGPGQAVAVPAEGRPEIRILRAVRRSSSSMRVRCSAFSRRVRRR